MLLLLLWGLRRLTVGPDQFADEVGDNRHLENECVYQEVCVGGELGRRLSELERKQRRRIKTDIAGSESGTEGG